MAESLIEWTEHTWNPVRGCTKVSPGCAHCYAETFAERWRGVEGHPYEQGFDLRLVPGKLDEPLHRKKPTTYFVNSMSDLFQEGVPDEFIDRVFAVMALTPHHTYQVLTKRADRMHAYLVSRGPGGDTHTIGSAMAQFRLGAFDAMGHAVLRWPLPNLWLGVSVENQHFANERIPLLLKTPAAVRFISAEPLLEAVDLERAIWDHVDQDTVLSFSKPFDEKTAVTNTLPGLDWVIVGGESGPGARSFDLAWARSIVSQCQSAGVPVFVKQLGAEAVDGRQAPGSSDYTLNYKHSKAGDPSEWPEDLRVRQMPQQHGATA